MDNNFEIGQRYRVTHSTIGRFDGVCVDPDLMGRNRCHIRFEAINHEVVFPFRTQPDWIIPVGGMFSININRVQKVQVI